MKKRIAIFGGGPASLALASFLNPDLFEVTIYEQNKTCGRKFLVAGKGGFNLTYYEPLDRFKKRYLPSSFLEQSLDHFSNSDFRDWLSKIGIETYVGSSNRVFPIKGIKPIEVLDAILTHIKSKGTEFKYQMKWDGWSANGLPIVNEDIEIEADYCVYAFGGGSWKITGSSGSWIDQFKLASIDIKDFEPSNCAFKVIWPESLKHQYQGKPLKNIAIKCNDKIQKGEVVITRFGIEGNAVYPLSNNIRHQLNKEGIAKIYIDFKPTFTTDELLSKFLKSKSSNITEFLKRDLKLSKLQIAMIKQMIPKDTFLNKDKLADVVKAFPLELIGLAPIDEAISTIGGVERDELTAIFELMKMKRHFCIGEMVDWDAPTGGYLLQGCFSMGAFLADYLNGMEDQ